MNAAPTDPPALLTMRGIDKTFDGVLALSGVDFTLKAGSVHALVGENGAGKSTLIKVLTGAYRANAGTILLEGAPVMFRSPTEALARGVVAVHQEVSVLLHRSVADNVFLGREPHRFGWLDRRAMNEATQALLEGLGLELDPRAILHELPIAQRQMVAIARGASVGAKVLVLDEPTSSLPAPTVKLLYDVIERLRARGTGVVYISHRFDELEAVCDTVTVLRDGKHVASRPLAGLDRAELVSLMLGKQHSELRTRAAPIESARDSAHENRAPALEVGHLAAQSALKDVSFAARAGEIVGLSGLLGSGRSETVRAIFGADRATEGSVSVGGKQLHLRSPRDGIHAGLALLPEDRGRDGIVPDLSLRENLTLALLPRLSRAGLVTRGRERPIVEEFMARLRIKAASAEQPIRELSGGNQQKVLLARWLCRQPDVLLLDDPTRGIDIGAKAEIQTLIEQMRAAGLCVVMISSELEELIARCSRIIVLREGRSVAELAGREIHPGAIIDAMAGRPNTKPETSG